MPHTNKTQQRSLRHRITATFATFVAAMMAMVTVVVTVILGGVLTGNLTANLRNRATFESGLVAQRLEYLLESTETLAKNPLVTSGIVDQAGRADYLPKLVQNFDETSQVSSLALVDFDGKPLFSTLASPPTYEDSEYLRTTLARGLTSAYVDRTGRMLVVMTPIEYYATTMGALVVEFDLPAVARRVFPENDALSHRLLTPEGIVFASNYRTGRDYLVATQPLADRQLPPALRSLSLSLEVGAEKNKYLAPVRHTAVAIGLLGAVVTLIAIFMATRIGRSIASPILLLCRRVEEADGSSERRCAPVGTGDELEELARLFDARTGELRQIQTELEARVYERTRSLTEARTRLEKAYEQLKESNEREKQAQEIAHLGYWDWDIASDALVWSDEIYRIFGWEPQAFSPTYERFLDAMLATDREKVQEAVGRVLAEPATEYNIEHQIFRPDGSRRVVQEIGRVIRGGEGQPIRMVGAVLDITDRVKAQEDLELYRLMIEKSADPVFLIDIEDGFRMAYVNEAAVRHYGAPREEILTWRIPDWDPLFTVDDLDAHLERMRANPGQVIETIHRVDGGRRQVPVEVSLNLTMYKGKLYHFGYFKDISDRKEVERHLREAKEKAEAADRSKSQFLANMSHEIRTPMNAVINLTRLVLQGELTPRQRGHLVKVLRAGGNLLGVINDILDFSKIEAGKLVMESITFDLDELLDDVAGVVAPLVLDKKIEFLIDFPPDLPRRLRGDAMRLGQVLTNLVGNGVKFTDRGEVVLAVAVTKRTAAEVELTFSVRDSGIGMSEEQLGGLCKPFQQADGSITRRYGGTGLGLAISRQLLALMGSELTVASAPGRGSTFRFPLRLPLDEAPQTALPGARPDGKPRTLVVDDNVTARRILQEMLAPLHIEARSAAGGAEALEKTVQAADSGHPYDLILIDWRMPEMDGIELAGRIRTEPRITPQPQLVLVTAHGSDEIRKEARRAGFATIMEKPVNPSRLYDFVIGRAIGQSPYRLAAEAHRPVPGLAATRGARVLVVEDNEINQEITVELLTAAGLAVSVAANGVEALAALTRERFDLVLMDIQMPEMDGYEATRRIRLQEAHRDLPILAMTAHAMSGDRERCLQAGMNDHLTKPIDIEALHRALVRWIPADARSAAMAAPQPVPTDDGGEWLPKSLPGIDIGMGLRRSGDNRALYLRLLRHFGAAHAGTADGIRTALDHGQREEARHLAHSVKGVAGNLGAGVLFEAAADLEELLAGPGEGAAPALDRFSERLTEVLAGLAPLLAAEVAATEVAPAASGRKVEPTTVLALLEELQSLLDSDFGAARHCFDRLKPLLASLPLRVEAEELGRALAEYDTDQAGTLIHRLKQRIRE